MASDSSVKLDKNTPESKWKEILKPAEVFFMHEFLSWRFERCSLEIEDFHQYTLIWTSSPKILHDRHTSYVALTC